jgi:hypothetical protein
MKNVFELGDILIMPQAKQHLKEVGVNSDSLLVRHAACDWGDIENFEKEDNEIALKEGGILLSSYKLPDGTYVMVTTSRERTATTVSLPTEWVEP